MTARPARPFGFPREARLKRRQLIRPLFDRSRQDVKTVASGSIRLLYRVVPRALAQSTGCIQTGFAVGRSSSSVERNRQRRTLREVYRLNQDIVRRAFRSQTEMLTIMVVLRGGDTDRVRSDLPEALVALAARLRDTGDRSTRRP